MTDYKYMVLIKDFTFVDSPPGCLYRELNQEKNKVEGVEEIGELECRPPVTEYKLVCDELDSEKSRALDIQVF